MKYLLPLLFVSFASFGQDEITDSEKQALDVTCACANEALEEVNYFMTTILNYIKDHPEEGVDFDDEDLLAELTEKQAAEYLRQEEIFDSILDTDEIEACIEESPGMVDILDDGFEEGRFETYIMYLRRSECYALETIFGLMMYDY
ncbi:MAG: hypothetical protein HWE14_14920 [Flavobacteriia bacterium]|nr:hypothetical protein [Flavobacteriia bacterium]